MLSLANLNMKSLLWSSVAIVTSTSLSSADIFTSSSDLNYLLYSTSIEMLCLARQSQLALRVKKYIPLALHLINTYKMCILNETVSVDFKPAVAGLK